MSKLIISVFITTIILFGGTVNVEVTQIKNQRGFLFIGLYHSAETFLTKTEVYKGAIIDINVTHASYQFKNIPNGTYAISLFHDENNNEILDTNFLGIPKEGYGFSNNAKATFSGPSFDEAKFELNETMSIKIEMDY